MRQDQDGSSHFFRSQHYTIWQLLKAYWQSEHRFSAYLSYLTLVIMTIALVGLEVVFNYWYNYFYNALQAYDMHAAIRLLIFFFLLAGIFIVISVYRYYITQLFGLRWRRWLTNEFIDRWLQNRGYYYLESFDDKKTDNPEQRIQDDIATLISSSIDLSIGMIAAVTTFVAFIYILWTLSGIFHIHLGSWGVLHIPGYLVWVSIIYSVVGTFLTIKIGRPLVGLNFEQQRREATFRFAAMDMRVHAEDVALYRGEHHQETILHKLFGRVLDNWYFIIVRQKLLLWFTQGFNQVSVVLPLVVALPNYFEKVFLLGGLMQTLRAFTSVQDSLAFIINSYPQIAQWQAIAERLTTFINHLNDAEKKAENANQVTMLEQANNMISAKAMTICTPRHHVLLNNINEEFMHGKHYLIKGESGIGKSTFVKTLAGIWPFATGEVIFPKQKHVMYLPQQPYMPIGTLAEAILFPDKSHPELVKQLESILQDCRLESFIPRLHETASWAEQLSPGEQQRISFARVLLHRPDWVFLDESTSMLDLPNESHLYQLVKKKLPHCSIISVGHRPSLDSYHDHVIDMSKYTYQASTVV